MRTRRAVAVLVSRFPLVTETFVLREIEEMERQGQPVLLVPLLREKPAVVHREAEEWMARALYTPFLSAAIAGATLRELRRDPWRLLSLLARVARGNARSANFLVRALAFFPKCVYLAERLRAEGVGHLHAHFATHPALAAYVISSLTGISYSFTAHAHDLFVRSVFLPAKVRAARFVRTISRFNRDLLATLVPDAGEGKIRVIHAGVDPARYDQGSTDPALPHEPPRVLCVAALKAYKGLPVLLEACRRLRDDGIAFASEIVGEGPLRGTIEEAVVAAGLTDVVRLLGPRTQDEVARLMAASSIVVLPSVVAPDGQMDGIPVSLMEAMASRRAVVGSRLSGIPELVEDGVNGILVPPGDVAALAAALKRLLADPDLTRRMGERGRETVEREYSIDTCVTELLVAIDAENEALSPALAERLRGVGLDNGVVGVRRLHERPESTVAELVVAGDVGGTRELVLKIQATDPASESARREFEVLSLLHARFGGGGACGVPRPLALDEDAATLLMERCRGRPLIDMVRALRARRPPSPLISTVRRAGRWLHLFQKHTAREGDALAAQEALLARARRDLENLPRRLTLAARDRLDRLAHRVPPPCLVGHHGDFWPGNVYVDEERVQVIDFEGFSEALPYEDAAYFLVQLGLFFAYPVLRRGFAPLETAFLDGYLGGTALDPVAWELCRMASALHVLARGRTGRTDTGLRARWRRSALRRLVLGKRP